MSKSGRNKKGSEDKSKNEYFSWSDDEAELLLKVTIDYKTSKENVDWESCQTKYQDILDKYLEQYPSPEEAIALGKDYPHAKDEMTKVSHVGFLNEKDAGREITWQSWRQPIRKVPVTNCSPSTLLRLAGTFLPGKNCSTLESVFKTLRIRWRIVPDTCGLVWTEGVSG